MTAAQFEKLPFTLDRLKQYLTDVIGDDIELQQVQRLAVGKELKEYGYGKPLLIEYVKHGQPQRAVLNTIAASSFGHERRSDRAADLLLAHETYNSLPDHAQSVDIGAFTADGGLISLGEAGEFFQVVEFVTGEPYAHDLQRIAETGTHTDLDEQRVTAMADYLARIHADKRPDAMLYQRRIRDLLADGEGIIGMLDTYPADFALAPQSWLESVEKRCVEWRWRVKPHSHRLSQVHGDFHPWNILFADNTTFTAIDRSRGAWGEPGDDVSAMTINYILFSIQQQGTLSGSFLRLWHLFWERYLSETEDEEVLTVVQPFFAWRLLVVAHPLWYPSLTDDARIRLFRLLDTILATKRFDPANICEYVAC